MAEAVFRGSCSKINCQYRRIDLSCTSGVDQGIGRLERSPTPPYGSNFIHHNFVQFGKQHSRHKGILLSIILSQQCCEVYFISLAVAKLLRDLITKFYWNRHPPNLAGWLRPGALNNGNYVCFQPPSCVRIQSPTWWSSCPVFWRATTPVPAGMTSTLTWWSNVGVLPPSAPCWKR